VAVREQSGRDSGHQLALERLVFFSDAVFAIAITLLALELKVPDIEPGRAADLLPAALLALAPKYIAFLITFLVVGGYWQLHHRYFRHINAFDGRLIWLNLLLLISVAFLPFPTAVLGSYVGERTAIVFYTCSVSFTGLVAYFLWRYVSTGRRLIDRELPQAEVALLGRRTLVGPAVFLASIPLAIWHAPLAGISWTLIGPLLFWLSRSQKPSRTRPATSGHHPRTGRA
jgi:uncharacterized membrane protein